MSIFKYKYFDTPDGQDVEKKLFVITKNTLIFGLGVSTANVFAVSKPKGYAAVLGRYIAITSPLVGMGLAFTATTHILTRVRGKDDNLNYALGAIASSSIWGAAKKSCVKATWIAILLVPLAIVTKDVVSSGYVIYDTSKKAIGSIDHWSVDWSIMKDYPGNWVSETPNK